MTTNTITITVKKRDLTDLGATRREAKKAGDDIASGLKDGFDKAERAGKKASDSIGDDLGKSGKAGKQAGDQIAAGVAEGADKAGKAGQRAGQEVAAGISEGAERGGQQASSSLRDSLKGGLTALGGVAATAGLAIGSLMMAGVQDAMERERVQATFVRDLGATQAQAARLGKVAGKAYVDGFGDSLDGVATAIKGLVRADVISMDAPVGEIERLAKAAITTADTVEEDVTKVARSVSTMLRTGMADSAAEAMDIVVKATQNGLNVSEDLLDTIDEYSTQFRKLGLDGPAAFGLIQQAVQAGARDTDVAADAIKEFALLSVDGSEKTAQAFRALGLDAETTAAALARGGPEAAATFGMVLDKLRQMPDPLQRNATAVGLFGTKAEDLGDALYSMDLDDAVEKFGEFEGAVKRSNDVLEQTAAQKWEAFGRGLKDVAGDSANAIMDLGDSLGDLSDKLWGSQGWKEHIVNQVEATKAAEIAKAATKGQGKAVEDTTASLRRQEAALDDLIKKDNEFYDKSFDLRGAQRDYQAAIDDATASLKENGKGFDITTDAGRANEQALDDLAVSTKELVEAMLDSGRSGEEVAATMMAARERFIAMAGSMGMSKEAAGLLADKLGLIPGRYEAVINANTAQAEERLANFRWLVNDATRSKTVTVTYNGVWNGMSVNTTAPSGVGRKATGGVVGSHAAEGGPRGGDVLVGEYGPEVVNLAPGSQVTPAGQTAAMLAEPQPVVVQLEVVSSGGAFADWMAEAIRKFVRVRGGDVQAVLGGR